ncbi:hypothetical protein LguiB_003144 [Lonicera macranthoides]
MALCFPSAWPSQSLIKSRSSASFPLIIKCHVATPSAFHISPPSALSLPKNPNTTPPLPSLTCALQCPHFESCFGFTQEFNLHRPLILTRSPPSSTNLAFLISNLTLINCLAPSG